MAQSGGLIVPEPSSPLLRRPVDAFAAADRLMDTVEELMRRYERHPAGESEFMDGLRRGWAQAISELTLIPLTEVITELEER